MPLTFAGAARIGVDRPEGRLFICAKDRFGVNARQGIGFIDLVSGTWTKIADGNDNLGRVSPDGRFVAYRGLAKLDNPRSTAVLVSDTAGTSPPELLFEPGAYVSAWKSDGQALLVQTSRRAPREPAAHETWRVGFAQKVPEKLPIPLTDVIQDWSPDGSQLLVSTLGSQKDGQNNDTVITPVYVTSMNGGQRVRIVDEYQLEHPGVPSASQSRSRFTPDGKTVIYASFAKPRPDVLQTSLWSVGVNGQHRECLVRANGDEYIDSFCVSPNGRYIAISFVRDHEKDGKGERVPSRVWELEIVRIEDKVRTLVPLALSRLSLLDWCPAAR
jgi:Tol biopolymer transport system component